MNYRCGIISKSNTESCVCVCMYVGMYAKIIRFYAAVLKPSFTQLLDWVFGVWVRGLDCLSGLECRLRGWRVCYGDLSHGLWIVDLTDIEV